MSEVMLTVLRTVDPNAVDRWLSSHLEDFVALAHLCPRCGSTSHGRPSVGVDGWHVSLGRTTRLTVVALGRQPLGVDVTEVGPAVVEAYDAIEPGVLVSAEEAARRWTLLEAGLKLAGTGFLGPAVTPAWVHTSRLDSGEVVTVVGDGDRPTVGWVPAVEW